MRLGVAGIFASHGWLAYQLKPQWFNYLSTVWIKGDTAITVMQAIGIMDLSIAIVTLIKPIRPVLLWATIWAFSTALIRPISGEAWVEFFERTGNWVCPLVLFFILHYKAHSSTIPASTK